MKTYTTCAGCRLEVLVTDELPNLHIGCTPPPPTEVDKLCADFVQAVIDGNDNLAQQLEQRIDHLTNTAPGLAAAAVWYAKVLGWPVFPLVPREKRPAVGSGFSRGCNDATTDVDRITDYWTRNPHANIGLATGHTFDVIDIDVPAGVPSYMTIIADHRMPDVHGKVVTSSGGLHLYVKPNGLGNTAGIMPGIDYRGIGGYVVAPPSWLGTRGTSWSWSSMPSPHITGKRT